MRQPRRSGARLLRFRAPGITVLTPGWSMTLRPGRGARRGRAARLHVHPAVDGDDGAGDVVGVVVDEELDGAGDVVPLAGPAYRDAGHDLLDDVRRDGRGHLGLDVAG